MQILTHVVSKITSNYNFESFCHFLGLPNDEIQAVKTDHRDSIRMQAKSGIDIWKRGGHSYKPRKWGTIISGFEHIGLADYAAELREKVVQGRL